MDSTLYLGASLAALPLAPSLDRLSRGVRWARPALDGFVLVTVGLLVVVHLLPHAIEHVGGGALLAAAAGLAFPLILEALPDRMTRGGGSQWAVGLAVAGLLLHVLMDGAALGTSAHGDHEHGSLALAVLVHRVPVSLFVWWTVVPRRGPRAGVLLLIAIGVFTVLGYGLGNALFAVADGHDVALVEAFIAGALLHVLGGHGLRAVGARPDASAPRWETAGALAALAVIFFVPLDADQTASLYAGSRTVPQALLHLLLESAPALVLGYVLAGLVGTQLPRATVAWAARGGALSRSARGVLFGLPIPICSCGVVPVYRSLAKAGLPASAGMAFLVATPELGIESVLLSFPLLGLEFTVARVLAAAVVAMVVGIVVGRAVPTMAASPEHAPTPDAAPLKVRLQKAFDLGFDEILEQTGPWILAGLVVAALLDPAMVGEMTRALPPGLGVVLAALVGLPLYVCASGATPLAAALVFGGLSPGAALAFLLAGPATNLTTFGVLSRLHGRRTGILFGVTVLLAAVGVGLAVDAAWPANWVPPAHGHGDEGFSVLNWAALAVLGAAGLRLMLRRGPQALLHTLYESGGHDHDHGGHDHDHHDHDHGGHDDGHGCGSDREDCCGHDH